MRGIHTRVVQGCSWIVWNCSLRASSSGSYAVGGNHGDLYKVLGLPSNADEEQIRHAFRQAAKKCHPDLHGGPTAEEEFRRCLQAYQVLMDKEFRQPCALSLKSSTSRVVHAATDAIPHSAPKAQFDGSFRRGLGGAHWRSKHAEQSREDAVAHSQMGAVGIGIDTIAEELDQSLQEVHWGPSLVGLVEGCLPPAFEAEHRSWPDDGLDLLQLVSGPTILGSVWCSYAPLLPAPGSGCHQLQGGQVHGALNSHEEPSSGFHASASVVCSREGDRGEAQPRELDSHGRGWYDAPAAWITGGLHEPELLSRHLWGDSRHGTRVRATELTFTVSNTEQVKAVAHTEGDLRWLEMLCAVSGQVLGYVLGDTITDAQGTITHTIVKVNTPGVLKMWIMAHASGKAAFTASRTWLPDHRFWFVPPRALEYSTGGWYIEWAGGQGNRGLHPGIACCLIGFQALEFEHGVNVPWWLKSTVQAPPRHDRLLPM